MPTIDKRIHGIKRRINVRAFSANARGGSEELILKNARIFCERLGGGAKSPKQNLATNGKPNTAAEGAHWSSAHDISVMSGYVTSDIIGDLTFNRN